jgi:hypothetical protein
MTTVGADGWDCGSAETPALTTFLGTIVRDKPRYHVTADVTLLR